MVQFYIEVASKILCFSLLIFQGILLNAYLVRIFDVTWWAWICADIIVVSIWSISLAMVRKGFTVMKRKREDGDYIVGKDPEQSPDEIKYSYLAWSVYVIFLCPRVSLIFLNIDGNIVDRDVLGSNLLKVVVACAPLVYLLLVNGFHNAAPLTSRKLYIQSLAASGTLDLFDSVDLLELLFEPQQYNILIPHQYVTAIVFFASVNWFLPILGLTGLRIKTISGRVASFYLKAANVICVMALVNIPNLFIRASLWINYDADVSVLIMKNVLCLFLGLYEIFEYFGEKPPLMCDRCTDWYDHKSYGHHRETCRAKYQTYSSCPVGDVDGYRDL